jgi:FKBP-type peptidyl-prolyl cis-trans isomerase SlpA
MRPAPGSRVCLRFSLCLEDGTEVDGTGDDGPWCFVVGAGNLAPALEASVSELASGESRIFAYGPGAVFGFRDEALIHPIPLAEFPEGLEPAAGLVVAFETPSGEELPGTIVEVQDDQAMVDFNHPLAGRALLLDVELMSVTSAEE